MDIATCFFPSGEILSQSHAPQKRHLSLAGEWCVVFMCLWVNVIDDNCRHVTVTRSAPSRAETVQRGAFSKNGGRSGTADYVNNQGKLDSSLQVNVVMATVTSLLHWVAQETGHVEMT